MQMVKMIDKVNGKAFCVILSVITIVVIHIFSSPAYFALSPECKPCPDCCNMQEKVNRKDHLLESVSSKYPSFTHMAKTEFRLTVPFFAAILHIDSKVGIYILQALAGLAFFIVLSTMVYKIINDKVITSLFVLAFGFIYPGYSFFAEMEGFFDSFAFLFLLIAMADIHFLLIAVALFFAFWTDERSLFSGAFIVFWWQYRQFVKTNKSFFLPGIQAYTFGFTVLLYISVRWYLVNNYGFVNQLAGTGTIASTIDYAGMALWQAFEGYWLLIALALYGLYIKKQYAIMLIFIVINMCIFFIGMNVMDITRSIAYIFPAIIIAFFIIKDQFDLKQMKQLMLIVLLFCFMYPAYSFIATKPPHAYHPVYMRAAKKILHIP